MPENQRTNEELEQHARRLALLHEISSQISAVLDLDRLLERTARLVHETFGYHHVGLFTLDGDCGELVMRASAGLFDSLFPAGHRVPLGQGMVGWVGRHGETLLANDVEAEAHYANFYPDLIPTQAELSVPLRVGEEVVGVLDVQSAEPDAFDESDVLMMETLADQVAVGFQNARLFAEMTRLKVFNEGIVQTVPGAIVVTDVEGFMTFVNPATSELVGYPSGELVGRHWSVLFAPDQQALVEAAQQRRRHGEFDRYEVEILRQDGTPVPVLISGSPQYDAETGEFSGSLAVLFNIAERKEAEMALRAREQRLRLMVEHLPAGAVYREGSSILINQAVEAITGYDRSEITTLDQWFAALYGEDAAIARRYYQADRAAHFPETRTMQIRSKKGERRVVDFAAYRFEQGEVWLVYDVTEREQTKAALRRLNSTLEAQVEARTLQIRAEREKSETILQAVGDAICVFSSTGRVTYLNPAFTALTGYEAKELLGEPADLLLSEGIVDHDPESLDRALTLGKRWQGEMTIQRKDGRVYAAQMTVSPIRDAQGCVTGYVSSHRDISLLKELERARTQFIANVSHELRTPVTNLKLAAQLLREGRRPERTDRFLQVIEEQTERLGHLIEDIIEMAEFDSGKLIVQWLPISVPSMLIEAAHLFRQRAKAAGLRLEVRPVPSDLPQVKGDAVRLLQALGEILDNALIFTPPGGRVTIGVDQREHEGQPWVTIWVKDNGPGIEAEEQARIFERLYRGREAESGAVPGTGLGLSKAQEILQAHGGRVTVESEGLPGRGSTFTLWLRSSEAAPSALGTSPVRGSDQK